MAFIYHSDKILRRPDKHIMAIVSGILLLVSCSNGTDQKKQKMFISNHEKYVRADYSGKPDSLKFKPDISIGKISLASSKSIDKYLGEDVMAHLLVQGIPHSSILSSNLKQRLTFYFHPGGTNKEFSEFEVSYVSQTKKDEKVTSDKVFRTESGIELGITLGELESIKGRPFSITKNEKTILYYKIDDFKNSEFLQKNNMPVYYADYEFDKGLLIRFRFGFEYP